MSRTPKPPRADLTVEVYTDKYWQLWAMSIVGVNLKEHCQKSLIGPKVRGLGPGLTPGEVQYRHMPTTFEPLLAYYVCGVSWYNDLARNAHLFAIPAAGEIAELEWEWGRAEITNARLVPVVPDYIDPADPHAKVRSFYTCRNWQAAWMLSKRQPTLNYQPEQETLL